MLNFHQIESQTIKLHRNISNLEYSKWYNVILVLGMRKLMYRILMSVEKVNARKINDHFDGRIKKDITDKV